MSPVHVLGQILASGQPLSLDALDTLAPPQAAAAASPAAAGVAGVILGCAKVAAQFLGAEIIGDQQKSDLYASELKFAECDVLGWAECLTTYLAFKAACGTLPYRPNQNAVANLPGERYDRNHRRLGNRRRRRDQPP